MSDSLELKTIKQCTSQLETALIGLDRKLVHFLNQEGFIQDSICERILNSQSSMDDTEKAGQLVKWIKNRVKQDHQSYHTLLNYFKEGGKHYKPIVNTLEGEFGSLNIYECSGTSNNCQQEGQNVTCSVTPQRQHGGE